MEGQDTVNSKTEPIKVPRFIEISERTIDDVDNKSKPDTGKVVLKYKDIALEFHGGCHKFLPSIYFLIKLKQNFKIS